MSRSMSWSSRTIDTTLGEANRLVNVKSLTAYTDGSGCPAVIEVTGYEFAFDYLGEVKCNLIGHPVVTSRMASEGACRRAKAAYTKLVHALLTAQWFALNTAMYPEAVQP